MKKLLFIGLAVVIGIAVGSEVFQYKETHRPDTSQTRVEPEYREQFKATCAVASSNSKTPPRYGGTGILLDTGYILTAQHVVDLNNNGKIDGQERIVSLYFYYPKPMKILGEVVLVNNKALKLAGKLADFAIIKPEKPIKSTIKLIDRKDYEMFGVGKPIFTIGRMAGDFPHLTIGNKSFPIGDNNTDRGALDIWHGNSGGGIFSKDTGELIGLCSTIRKVRGRWGTTHPLPGWMEYCDANQIRTFLELEERTDYIDAPYEPAITMEVRLAGLFLAITLGGLVYAFRENISQKVRKL